MRHLREQGIPLIEGPVVKSGAMGEISSVYFLDPDANLIEVSVYPHLQEGGHRHSDGKECR